MKLSNKKPSKATAVHLTLICLPLLLVGVAAPAKANPERLSAKTESTLSGENATSSLQHLVDSYWEDYLADRPISATLVGDYRYNDRLYDISENAYRRRFATARRFLESAGAIREQDLSAKEKVTLKVLRGMLAVTVEGEMHHAYRDENYLLPLDQIAGFHLRLLSLPANHPFTSAEDYQTYAARLAAFPAQVDAAIANMQKGLQLGIVSPRPVVEAVIKQLQSTIATQPRKSALYQPLERFPKSVSTEQRVKLSADIEREIASHVVASFQKLLDFVQADYLPRSTSTFGLSRLPGGKEKFAYAVKVQTTTDLSPDQIYDLGLEELKKITAEREAFLKQLGFKGTLVQFNQQAQNDKGLRLFSSADVEKVISDNLRYMEPRLQQLFANPAKFNYRLKPVESYRAANFPNGAVYTENEGGKRISVFYYNTHGIESEGIRKFMLPSLAFHEAFPGHLLQANYAWANSSMPAFRRHSDFNAFNEGWGKYAESLADELGAYRDPYARNFWLSAATFAYVSLVAEVGMESKGWSREQTYDFIRQYLPMPEARFDDYLLRWSVMPAQGLGYAVGALKFHELRTEAEQELGSRFDVRAFHDLLLNNGSMQLDVLDDLVGEWIAERKAKN